MFDSALTDDPVACLVPFVSTRPSHMHPQLFVKPDVGLALFGESHPLHTEAVKVSQPFRIVRW